VGSPASYIDYDECLGTSTEDQIYHYHALSPCIIPSAISERPYIGFCNDNAECKKDKIAYAIKHFTYKSLIKVAIAKDGREVYGPYKRDGTLWQPCDVDACNGVWIDGYYSYVSTTFYPYFIGCWGPAAPTNYVPQCTSKARVCKSSAYWSMGQSVITVMVIFASIFSFL